MSELHSAFISVSDAGHVFGLSKRTIERKLTSGEISGTQTRIEYGKRLVSVAELMRVF